MLKCLCLHVYRSLIRVDARLEDVHVNIVTILLASLSSRCAISTINFILYFHAPGFTLITYIEILIGKSVIKMCSEWVNCYVVIYMFLYIYL